MALSDADLHWIPMNRSKFDQIRKMFDVKEQVKSPCDKCTSPRIRYTSAENVSALSQIRALLRPVEHTDTSSTSSRSRSTSAESLELRSRNHSQQIHHPLNGHVIIDPILCSKTFSNKDNGIMNNNSLINDGGKDKLRSCETVGETTVHVSVGEPIRPTDNGQVNENNININNIDPLDEVNSLIKENGLTNGCMNKISDTPSAPFLNIDTNDSQDDSEDSIDDLLDPEIHNNNIYLNMVNSQSEVLSKEREYFVNVLDSNDNLSEEASGRVMAACGKANLLLTSKFKQYRNLCYDYEKTTRQMTSDDMQGFWELILLQVDDVMSSFKALRKLEENNWVIPRSPMPQKKADAKKGAGTPASSKKKKPREKTPAQIARDEARRQMLAAKKEEMRQRLKEQGNNSNSPEIIIAT